MSRTRPRGVTSVSTYSLSHLSDHVLLRDLTALVARDRTITAALLAHMAEVDARRLYLPAGYPSMSAYCVKEFGMSEDAAYKRIGAARTARQYPKILEAVADGRLNLNAVVLLKPHLTLENADDLLAAASHKTRFEIEQLLAERFPRSEMLPMVQALPAANPQPAPGPVEPPPDVQLAARPVAPPVPRGKATAIAPQRFALQLTMSQGTHDKLRYAQDLLSHQIPNGDIAKVLDRALDALILQLEKRKFAATKKPKAPKGRSSNPRTITAQVRRAVMKRDGGQCTFVSESGRRCSAREQLEFDHVDPVARGGEATVNGIRLLCRAHNHYAAEWAFGAEFMSRKRQEARAAAAARAAAISRSAAAKERAKEVIPWLERLGISAHEARRAAALCETIPDAPIEDRVRVALSCFGPRTPSRGRVAQSAGCGP